MNFCQYIREHLPPLLVPREPEILEELAQHLEDLYREARSAGLDETQALARATQALTASMQTARDFRTSSRAPAARLIDSMHAALAEPVPPGAGWRGLAADLRRDIRYALRSLLQEPGFTTVAILTLAVGIGANAVIFSAVNAVLLKDAPVDEPDRLVSVYTIWDARAATNPNRGNQVGSTSFLDFVDLRHSNAILDIAAFGEILVSLDPGDGGDRVTGHIVTGNFFQVLGVPAVVGRTLTPQDDVLGSPTRVVVVSHRLWQQRLGADEDAVGRAITLNGERYTVIGVAPRGFTGPALGDEADVWVPMALQEEARPPSAGALRRRLGGLNLLRARDVRWLNMIGRLKEGQSATAAATALDIVGRRLASAYPDSNRYLSATAISLGSSPGVRTRLQPVLLLLGAAVALVLLIACANVAGLMLTRAFARRREVAVRIAIGAGRDQVVRQWLTESVILGLMSAIAALVLAGWGPQLLRGLGIPESVDLSVDPTVLAFTLAAGIASGLFFGSAPVIQLVRHDPLVGLRDEGAAVASGVGAARLRSTFVVMQVAVSLVLLIGAGLFLRTLQQAYAVDLGYDTDRMLIAELALGERYTPESGLVVYRDVLDRIGRLPGVLSAGAARVTVLSGGSRNIPVSIDGQPLRQDRRNAIPVRANVVSIGYFEAMDIPVLRGRQFDPSDSPTAPRVVMISHSLAERLWPGADPVGRSVIGEDGPFRVIGIVPDTVYLRSTDSEPRPLLYQPLAQNYENALALHVRTAGDPLALIDAIRRSVREIDLRLVLARPRRLTDEFDRSVATERLLAKLTGTLSGVALLLAAVGLYGVMAFGVKQRAREMGLRTALGARPAAIVNLVIGRGIRLVALGLALGLLAAMGSVGFVRSQLFGVEPTDVVTWFGVCALLLIVGVIACGIPARRAMKVAPAVVLRNL